MNIFDVKKYSFNKALMARTIGDVLMVYNPDVGETMEINDVGKDIFFLLQEEKSINDIFQSLSDTYQVEIQDIKEDVTEFIERMIVLGVIILEN